MHTNGAQHGIEDADLVQWLKDNAGHTTELVKEIVNPFTEQHAEHLCLCTTWNEVAKRCQDKCKLVPLSQRKNYGFTPWASTKLARLSGCLNTTCCEWQYDHQWTFVKSCWTQCTSGCTAFPYSRFVIWWQWLTTINMILVILLSNCNLLSVKEGVRYVYISWSIIIIYYYNNVY